MQAPLQPLLHEQLVVLRAPTQAWSAQGGEMQGEGIHGVYFSDVRLIRGLRIQVGAEVAEHLATSGVESSRVRIDSVLRHLDAGTADPEIRLTLERIVDGNGMSDRLTVSNRHERPLATQISIHLDLDSASMDSVKGGGSSSASPSVRLTNDEGVSRALWVAQSIHATVTSTDLEVEQTPSGLHLSAAIDVPPRGERTLEWRLDAADASAVVRSDDRPTPWSTPLLAGGDQRLIRWIERALSDLDALRMTTVAHPEFTFLAAGAPWFLTLFGRDSIWAARFMLPLGTRLAGDTLRVLATMQGVDSRPESDQEPGKIMHELRRTTSELGHGVRLPPLYYGTVDATALWVCLLHDAWRWGLPDSEVIELLPHLEAALSWMRDHGDADGDGLLEYMKQSGDGLANHGWKDSGDSVQWRDGTPAEAPIALCEVQAYAYEAAMHGADLLQHFGRSGAEEWRAWAARLRSAFNERFWITDPALCGDLGPYPAVALDAKKRPVDSVTSNLGHLLGTGLLDEAQAALVAARLGSPELDSGFGLRTMSTDSVGYWPLSYHCGSVWTHDTVIAALGLAREGHLSVAMSLINGLLRAAETFGYRMPELHSGDGLGDVAAAVPYPAACHPQAWSAASAVATLTALAGLSPDLASGTIRSTSTENAGRMSVYGLRLGSQTIDLR